MPFNTEVPKAPSADDIKKPELESFAKPPTLPDHQDTGAAIEYQRKQSQVPNRAKWPRR